MKTLERRSLSVSVEEANMLKAISDESDVKIVDLANAMIHLLKDDKVVLLRALEKAKELDKKKKEEKHKTKLISKAFKGIDPAELEKILAKIK